MVITKTPFRMSFFGGGTDMKNFMKSMEAAFFLLPSINIAMLRYGICRSSLITLLSLYIPASKGSQILMKYGIL